MVFSEFIRANKGRVEWISRGLEGFHFAYALKMTLIGSILVVIYTISKPNVYLSEAKLLPPAGSGSEMEVGLSGLAAAAGFSLPGSRGKDGNYTDILKSRWMAENLLNFQYTYDFKDWYFGRPIRRTGTLSEYFRARNLDQGIMALDPALKVSKDQKSNVVSISFVSKSPELSRQVTARAVGLLDKFLRENMQVVGINKLKFIDSRIQDCQGGLDALSAEFRDYTRKNKNYASTTDPDVRLRVLQLESNLALQRQLLNSLIVSREKSVLDSKNDMPNLTILDQASLPTEKSGPNRSLIVIYSAFLELLIFWSLDNRNKLYEYFVGLAKESA